MARSVLITGGSGYFGSVLAEQALARGDAVRIFDLNPPGPALAGAEFVAGDVRDRAAVRGACDGIDVVFHNVAQVPLAKDRALFDAVNVGGTANVLVAARDARVGKVVHTSSSAVFGIPEQNPVTESTACRPLEAYGRAKLRAELLCADSVAAGLDVTVVRPRTVLGHGRLGVMALLFEFVADGAPVFVLGGGHNRYQLVHAADLADACLRAGDRSGPTVYNVGALDFGTMRALASLDLAPFAPYHWLLYSESLYFDVAKARTELGWEPRHSNAAMVIESYEWFLAHRREGDDPARSHHQSPVRPGLVRLLKALP